MNNRLEKIFKEIHGFWPGDEACESCKDRRSKHNARETSWDGHEFVSMNPIKKARK